MSEELTKEMVDFTAVVTQPIGKVTPSGSLRIAKVSQVDTKLIFTLLHDRFNR